MRITQLLRAAGAALLLALVIYCTAFFARAQQSITHAPPATQPTGSASSMPLQ